MSNYKSKLITAARILLGLIFFVFGLDGFLHFVPQPAPVGNAAVFIGGLAATGYFFPLLKGVELLAGAALLANRFVPLALTVLAPIVVNIVAFHAVMAPQGMPMAGAILLAQLGLAWAHRKSFAPLLASRSHLKAESPARSARPVRMAA